ncbi:uncharacterized protein LOC133383035 isoform X3 [Rhineura floridana]|uniref:uncharacterized protein LOC133383035 isoform X3 n=1 Tax=Rhineura floridana TaxID=261503 RepID=UPI002AC860A6|nr:uncharacterized protein LOC133383035 isoform X3 [Rhineura floridana]
MGAGGGEELTSSKIIRSEFMEVTTLEKEAAGRALGINSASSGALWDLAASTLTTSIQSAPGAYTSLPEAAAVPVANDTSLIALPSLLPGEALMSGPAHVLLCGHSVLFWALRCASSTDFSTQLHLSATAVLQW